jgi:hypothetical protein
MLAQALEKLTEKKVKEAAEMAELFEKLSIKL